MSKTPAAGLGSLALLIAACRGAPAAAPEGFINVPGGKVYYARMGNGPGTPLIVIHGGPGSSSYGLKPWAALGDDRPVIRYDQLGSGKSDRPTDTSLFTVDRAVRELQALRDSLGLKEVHLYGRSWGAMLIEAYLGSSPSGVKSVTLSSPLVTTAQWERDADSLKRLLPDSLQRALARFDSAAKAAGAGGKPPAEYQAAATEYYRRHVRRQPRRSTEPDSGGFGALVYDYMWGPNEFTATGTLKHFDATDWIKGFTVPTLFITGEFDEAAPSSVERFSKLVRGAEFKVVPGSGHSTENDNPDFLLATVRDFLRRADRRRP
jgi:proline iminopeptidase